MAVYFRSAVGNPSRTRPTLRMLVIALCVASLLGVATLAIAFPQGGDNALASTSLKESAAIKASQSVSESTAALAATSDKGPQAPEADAVQQPAASADARVDGAQNEADAGAESAGTETPGGYASNNPAPQPQRGGVAKEAGRDDSADESNVTGNLSQDGKEGDASDPSSADLDAPRPRPLTPQPFTPNGSHFRRTAAATATSCKAGSIFYVNQSGEIYEIAKKAVPINGRKFDHWLIETVPNNGVASYTYTQVNALGVGQNASVFYASRYWESQEKVVVGTDERGRNVTETRLKRRYQIYKYDTQTRRWSSVTSVANALLPGPFIAGAVNPLTGDYYIGGYDASDNSQKILYFNIWKYSPSENQFYSMGYFDTGLRANNLYDQNSIANGDMGFDSKGNLYIVRSGKNRGEDQDIKASIFTLRAEQLTTPTPEEEARGRLLVARRTVEKEVDRNINGIAFDVTGNLFLGDALQMRAYDPLRFKRQQTDYPRLTDTSTDLATCESPITISVEKEVRSRSHPNDRFELSMSQDGDLVATEITAGYESAGLSGRALADARMAADRLGPFPVSAGEVMSISEAMAQGSPSPMGNYRSRWRCTGPWASSQEPGGNGANGTFTIPNVPGAEIVCTITNEANRGVLTWDKVDQDATSQYLSGSEWSLVGPRNNSAPITVRDCVAARASACASSDRDVDPRAGRLRVEGLLYGRYVLTETAAPQGYAKSPQSLERTLTAASPTQSFGAITNKRIEAKVHLRTQLLDVDGSPIADASGWEMGVDLTSGTHQGITLTPARDGAKRLGQLQVTGSDGRANKPWVPAFLVDRDDRVNGGRADIVVSEALKPGWQQTKLVCQHHGANTGMVGDDSPFMVRNAIVPANGRVSQQVNGVIANMEFTCTFTNRRSPGELTWLKTDQLGRPLGESQWRISGLPGGDIAVRDCAAANRCAGTNDADPRKGYVRVTNLRWGRVTLEETAAPPGYVRDSQLRRAEITAHHRQHDFGSIRNVQVGLPALPFTGGLSQDLFVIVGFGVGVLSVASHFAGRGRGRRWAGAVAFPGRTSRFKEGDRGVS